jgi:hypothetical protein
LGAVLNGTGSRSQDYYYRYRTDYGVRSRHSDARKKDGYGTSAVSGGAKTSNPPAAD